MHRNVQFQMVAWGEDGALQRCECLGHTQHEVTDSQGKGESCIRTYKSP